MYECDTVAVAWMKIHRLHIEIMRYLSLNAVLLILMACRHFREKIKQAMPPQDYQPQVFAPLDLRW